MATARRQTLAWESSRYVPVGLAAFAATVLIVVSNIVVGGLSNNGHESDFLVSAHEHSSSVFIYAALQALGFLLLMAPLYFLFRATAARSDRFRRQFVGVVIAAPLFFAIAAILTGIVTNSAADKYAKGDAKPEMTQKEAAAECREELSDKGKDDFDEEWDERAKGETSTQFCAKKELEDDEAQHALSSSGLQGLGFGFGLAGRLGFAIAMLYTCLYAMRVGLLSRFWGSLGMALGIASLILAPEFALIFFIYFGVLCFGRLPGGRPPAWAAGEAVPWPTPGEKAAAELRPDNPEAEVVTAPELGTGEGGESDEGASSGEGAPAGETGEPADPSPGEESNPPKNPRKRKRRN